MPPSGNAAIPLRPDAAQLSGVPEAPQSFDQSLDDLVRQGVVTSTERNLMRGGAGLAPLDRNSYRQACQGGALSLHECRGSVSLRLLGRRAPEPAPGTKPTLEPLSVPVAALLAGDGSAFNLASVFRVTPRPAAVLGNGNRRLLLPVIGSALNTSGFGWRLHPLLGAWRLHAGEDLAAPEGTPVVAALSGRVLSSGLAGGYGLAVELEHRHPLRRSLYGHLSELYVSEGDPVAQGEVIGRVGSTGLSTGPHLHFELRQPSASGWVAIDPGEFDPGRALQNTDAVALLLAQLLQSLQRPGAAAGA